MSVTIWDPANLLQITFDADDLFGEIQCVGLARSRNNNRCRWTIEEPDRSKIRPLLIQMSKTQPRLVTTETLRQLAGLCLCPSYHSHQIGEVTARWNSVIKAAAQHHNNLAESLESAPSGDDSRVLRTQVPANLKLETSQALVASLQKRLDEEKSTAAQFAERTMGSINELRSEVAFWKDRAQQNGVTAQHLGESLGNEGVKFEKAKENISRLQERLQEAKTQLQTCQAERTQSREENENLQCEIYQARKVYAKQSEINENEKKIHQRAISDLQQSNRALDESLKKETDDRRKADESIGVLQTKLREANDQIQTHQTELVQIQMKNQSLKSQVSQVREDQKSSAEVFEKLRIKSNASQQMVQKRAEGFEASLHQCRTDLEHEKARLVDLDKNIKNLKITEQELKESISACWLHGFCIWVGGFRKKSEKHAEDLALLNIPPNGNNLV